LYELLTLRPAFDESDRNRLVAQVMHDAPPRPGKINPEIPRDLETIVLKAITREPEQRYQTPAELAEDLQRFLDDRPIKARRLGALARGWRLCRRNPALAVLAASLIFVLPVGTGVSIWQAVRATEAEGEARANEQAAKNQERMARENADKEERQRRQAVSNL